MGTMECTLAEAIAASSKGKFERGLSPFRQHLGDSGVGKFTVHYAQTWARQNFQEGDRIWCSRGGQNLKNFKRGD